MKRKIDDWDTIGIPRTRPRKKYSITGKDVAALLHRIHEHDPKTGKIIYYEENLLPVLQQLGLPAPEWGLSTNIKEWRKYKKK